MTTDDALAKLRQEYAEGEMDNDRNPTEDGFVEWLASRCRGSWTASSSADEMRARQRADRPKSLQHITLEYALAELRRYRVLYPEAPPEVAAFGLIRRVDQWDEVQAIQAAVDTILREGAQGE